MRALVESASVVLASNVIASSFHNPKFSIGLFSVPAPPFRLAASGGVFLFPNCRCDDAPP